MTETTRTETGLELPDLRRLRYFHGQLLGARDFRREQAYLRDKLRLRMRCLHGYGVVCGVRVEPVPAGDGESYDDADETLKGEGSSYEGEATAHQTYGPEDHRPRRAKVRVTDGLGVDCYGNEVVVSADPSCEIDLWTALPAEERVKWPGRATVWVGVQYAEQAVEPTRMVYDDACGGGSDCDFGYTQERFALRVTTTRPTPDSRCDTCGTCEDPVLWLARIEDVHPLWPIRQDQVHEEIRRPFGLRRPTVITGVNWIHGHTYSVDEAQELLGTFDDSGGLVVRFSDEVHVQSLQPGVVDLQIIEGGGGRNSGIWHMAGTFQDVPDEAFTREFRYQQRSQETLQDRDRVSITVRTGFILDRCCRPVDGTNVGGLVPQIDGSDEEPPYCAVPPSGIGPWTSGSGASGASFESWFFVRDQRVRDYR